MFTSHWIYPVVNSQKTDGKMTSFNWQINYFYGSFSIALLNYQRGTLWFSFGVTFIFNKFHGNERGDEVQTSRWNLDQIQRIKGYSEIPSGKHTKTDGKSPFLMGKSTISMAIFNSYVKLPEGKIHGGLVCWEHHRTRFSTLPCLITNGYFRQLFGRQPSDFCCFRFIVHAQISPVN